MYYDLECGVFPICEYEIFGDHLFYTGSTVIGIASENSGKVYIAYGYGHCNIDTFPPETYSAIPNMEVPPQPPFWDWTDYPGSPSPGHTWDLCPGWFNDDPLSCWIPVDVVGTDSSVQVTIRIQGVHNGVNLVATVTINFDFPGKTKYFRTNRYTKMHR